MKMLYEEKYTIDGAKKKLKDGTVDDAPSEPCRHDELKAELADILNILNS